MDWESVTLLICDEAHATLGAQTRKLLDRATNAVVVGFTATGATTTGHVEQVFGPVAATLDRMSAIERGILCPLRSLRVERAVDLSDVARRCAATSTRRAWAGPSTAPAGTAPAPRCGWSTSSRSSWPASRTPPPSPRPTRWPRSSPSAACAPPRCRARRPPASCSASSSTSRSERIDVLCNADLLTEGWDETRAAVVMHLAPTTSERVFVQRLGRVMRPAPDKEAVSVEFLPAGDPMGVQTSHEVFGLGWYKPLGRVAGPPEARRARQAGQGRGPPGRPRGRLGQAGQPRRRAGPDRRRPRRRRLARGRPGAAAGQPDGGVGPGGRRATSRSTSCIDRDHGRHRSAGRGPLVGAERPRRAPPAGRRRPAAVARLGHRPAGAARPAARPARTTSRAGCSTGCG